MKSKGFTLVELLGVIVILAIVFVLVAPSVTKIVSQSRETVYQKQINTILNAAYDFSLGHLNYLPENNSTNYVTLGQLKCEGLIDVDIKNTNTNEVFPDNLVISIKKVGTNHGSNNLSMLRGNYLYTVDMDKLSASSSLLPQIILSVDGDKELTKNSDGNYIMALDLNDSVPKLSVSATHSNTSTVDLTEQVKQYILLNNVVVDKIKTSKPEIYKINYSVVNKEGYATLATLNIIIGDNTPPTIAFPELATEISKETMNFDLENGVVCVDNSGVCEFTYNDIIKYGQSGTYTITYTVKDPSGNTSIKERVITVK